MSKAPLKIIAAIQAPQLLPWKKEVPSHGSLGRMLGPQGLELTSGIFIIVQELACLSWA